MHLRRLQCLIVAAALVTALGIVPAHAGPLAVVANFTNPATNTPPWPPGTVAIIDTATDQPVGAPLTVGPNPMAVAITPDGKTAVVACSQSSELYFIDLSANPPVVSGKVSVGSGSGDTFYPSGLAISPDGKYVAVTSWTGGKQNSTHIYSILLVSLADHTVAQTLDLTDSASNSKFSAEAAAFDPFGSILVVGPSSQPPVIFALGYNPDNGELVLPDGTDTSPQMGAFTNATGYNVTVSPDGSFALVPLGGTPGKLDTFSIDNSGKLTVGKELIDSGGSGPHSIALSPDGKTAYVRNMLPPTSNIAVFQVNSASDIKDTGVRLNCPGISASVLALASYQAGALIPAGSQMVAVTPDGKKIYATNPYGGAPDPNYLGLVGKGNLLIFQAGTPTPIKTLLGDANSLNPFAIAIQPK